MEPETSKIEELFYRRTPQLEFSNWCVYCKTASCCTPFFKVIVFLTGLLLEDVVKAASNFSLSAKDKGVSCVVFNPGAFTHSSIAIRDALSGTEIPFIEVHISNIYSREDFRQKSFLSDIADGVISGLGVEGYELALKVAIDKFGK